MDAKKRESLYLYFGLDNDWNAVAVQVVMIIRSSNALFCIKLQLSLIVCHITKCL